MQVVTRDSAILNIPNERAIPIASDHQRMTQFTQLHSPQFRSVWQGLYWIMVGEDGISGELS
jgi:hypothetical protein